MYVQFLIFKSIYFDIYRKHEQGSIGDKEGMIEILKRYEIEVVISAVGGATILEQLILAEAIKAVGSVKVRTMMEATGVYVYT